MATNTNAGKTTSTKSRATKASKQVPTAASTTSDACGSMDAPGNNVVVVDASNPDTGSTISVHVSNSEPDIVADNNTPVSDDNTDDSNNTVAKESGAYVTSLRRVQKAAKRLAEHLKSKADAEGRKIALEISREATKALANQESRQTGYQLFIKLNSPKFRQQIESDPDNVNMSKGAHTQLVFRKIAESWRSLDDAQKKHYNDLVSSTATNQPVSVST